MPKNYDKYSEFDRKIIKNKIIKAWKEKISPDGPPKADETFNYISVVLLSVTIGVMLWINSTC